MLWLNLFYKYWDLSTAMTVMEKALRTMKFHNRKVIVHCLRSDESDRMASHITLAVKTGKSPFYFQYVGKVCRCQFSWQFCCRTRKQSHITKNTTRCKALQSFLGTRNELSRVEEIPSIDLNEYISKFFILVRTKHRKNYEPCLLQSL